MVCPLYKDYTRGCVEHFKGLVNFSTFSMCESEGYKDCIFYNSIINQEKRCEFDERCIGMHLNIPVERFNLDIDGLNMMGKHYCFSENRKNCAIYKKFLRGEEVSPFLHPDGTMISVEQ